MNDIDVGSPSRPSVAGTAIRGSIAGSNANPGTTDAYSIQGFLYKYKKGITGAVTWKQNWLYVDHEVIHQYGGKNRPTSTETPKYSWNIAECFIQPTSIRKFSFEIKYTDKSNITHSVIYAAEDSKSYDSWMKVLLYHQNQYEDEEDDNEEDDANEDDAEDSTIDEKTNNNTAKNSTNYKESSPTEKLILGFFKKNKFRKVRITAVLHHDHMVKLTAII